MWMRWIVPVAAAAGAALLAAVVLGALSIWMGLAVFIWLCVAGGGLTWWLARKSHVPAVRRAVALERLRAQAVDVVAGQTELLMAGQLPTACQQLMQADAKVAQADHVLNRLDAKAATGFGIAGAITLAGVLAAAGGLVQAGVIGAPGAALALLVALTAMEPFSALRRGALEAGRTRLAVSRLGDKLTAPADAATAQAQSLSRPQDTELAAMLEAATVHYASSAVPALQAVDLRIAQGQKLAVVGASGAGKSTLLEVLAAELPLQAGCVEALPSVWLTQRIALSQDTVRDNLRVAAPDADDAAVWSALEDAGLAADVRAMPRALDTWLGEGGLGISGGQARRLGLARLFLANQPLWLLDEPTEGLDAPTARDVLQRLMQRAGDKTVVFSTHLQREASMADTLVYLSAGSVQAQAKKGEASFGEWVQGLRPD